MLAMLVLVVLMAGVETLGVISITPFLSVLGRPDIIQENPVLYSVYQYFDFVNNREFIIALGLASIVLVVFSSVFKIITQHVINRFVHLQRHALSSRLLSRYLAQPYEYFIEHNSAVLSKNVLAEVDQLMFDLVQPLSQLIAQGAIVFSMALLVLLYDPFMAVCIVGVLGCLYGFIYWVVRKRLGIIGKERREANGERYKVCNEVLEGIKDVKVTGSAQAYKKDFDQASRLFSRHWASSETMTQAPLNIVESIGYSGLIVIALVLLLRSQDVAFVLPALGLYAFAAYRMLPAAQVMYRGFARLKSSRAALNAICIDFNLPNTHIEASTQRLKCADCIVVENVRYSYRSAPSKRVLDNFDLVIPVNTSVGIVGRSGSGKSTLMDIMLGLLLPQKGRVLVDGVEVDHTNLAAWQRSIGYVPQRIFLSDASILENIAFGVPAEMIDMNAVERAAKSAQIHEFIVSELPDAYKTRVGDRGIRLSGGQAQRIGIARALYRDPQVVFFDEATSALDAETECAVNEAIEKLLGCKTVVVVSHRLSSLEKLDSLIDIGASNAGSNINETEKEAKRCE